MRAHVLAGVTFGIGAGFVASAVALAQTPFAFPIMTTPIVLDAGPPSAIDAATGDDASSTDAAPPIDAAPELAIPIPPPPPPPPPPPEDIDAGYTPSNVGFSVGLRVGYSVPFGSAKDAPVNSLVQGMVPIGVDVGWFFNPHFYVGGYFLYGIATGIEASNGVCDGVDESCSANMFRLGVVAHYHFRPETEVDPWLGGGIGYDIVNFQAQDTSVGTVDQSASLHGFDLTLDTGLDFKPLPYVGIGPFAELAVGHYNSDTSATALHEWLTFGLRLRTNL